MTEFPPYEYIENGEDKGINYITVSEVFKRAGYKTKFLPSTFQEALKLTASGEADAIFSIKESPDRKTDFIFSDLLIYMQDYFFKKKNLDIKANNIEDLKPYKIAIINNYFYGDEINKDNFPNLSPITSSIPELDNLKRLNNGEVDLVLCSMETCNYWIKKNSKLFIDIDSIKSPAAHSKQGLHIAFSRKDSARSNEIVKKFNEELAIYLAEEKAKKNISQ